jgi:hypothetical protein
MQIAMYLGIPGSHVEAAQTGYGECERDHIVCKTCELPVFLAGGKKHRKHFKHHPRTPEQMHLPPTSVCIQRAEQEVHKREHPDAAPPTPPMPRGQSLEKFLLAFEEHSMRLAGHGDSVRKLLASMRARPSFRQTLVHLRRPIWLMTIEGGEVADGSYAESMLTRTIKLSQEADEPEYSAVFCEGMTSTCKFLLAPTSTSAYLFAISLGLVTSLFKGVKDARSNRLTAHEMASRAENARIADYVMYSNAEFRRWTENGGKPFWRNTITLCSCSLLITAFEFTKGMIAEHTSPDTDKETA